jgi:hypothetical protein
MTVIEIKQKNENVEKKEYRHICFTYTAKSGRKYLDAKTVCTETNELRQALYEVVSNGVYDFALDLTSVKDLTPSIKSVISEIQTMVNGTLKNFHLIANRDTHVIHDLETILKVDEKEKSLITQGYTPLKDNVYIHEGHGKFFESLQDITGTPYYTRYLALLKKRDKIVGKSKEKSTRPSYEKSIANVDPADYLKQRGMEIIAKKIIPKDKRPEIIY